MKWTKIAKETFLKKSNKKFIIKSNIDWNNIDKAIDCEGTEYKISKHDDENVKVSGDGKTRIISNEIAFGLLDIYDKQGNKVSSRKDYE